MADQGTTGISWTDATWSPIRVRVKMDAAAIAEKKGYSSLIQIAAKMAGRVGPHCEHVSPGCENCYAETNNHRCLPANGTGLPYDRRSRDLVEAFIDEKILLQPLRWKTPKKIFVENQSDLFGDWVSDELIDRVFAVMALCPQHTFQVLTKRPARMLAWLANNRPLSSTADDVAATAEHIGKIVWDSRGSERYKYPPHSGDVSNRRTWPGWPLPNVWLGVSVEDWQAAEERIPLLLQTPAAVRWISAEPLLGPIRLRAVHNDEFDIDYLRGEVVESDPCSNHDRYPYGAKLDWVVVGGESGHGARPMDTEWARSLRDQCNVAGVAFHFKQMGGSKSHNDQPIPEDLQIRQYPQATAEVA